MARDTDKPRDERRERLAAALRENLKRRKAQARAADRPGVEAGEMREEAPSRPGKKDGGQEPV